MSKKLLFGFIAGAVAGTLAGILLAPAKGSTTRRRLSGKINDCLKNVSVASGLSENEDGDDDELSFAWEHAERPYASDVAW